jgi:NADPH:quinone reductase-like Zn-dependent oxidoreductase
MPNASAIVFHQYGSPGEVARCEDLMLPALGSRQALVRVLAAPINPADLNVIEGKYPLRPALPGVPGVEGAAVVAEIGVDVRGLQVGALVLLPHEFGTWREAGVVDADQLMAVPAGIGPEHAAMLKINPATALRMLRDFVRLAPGDWVVQNAANSAVGRAVIQLAREAGVKTVNVVRRAELVDELRSQGADVVLLEGDDLPARIKEATGGAEIPLALNAVGGDSAVRLANTLSLGGTIVTYGAMGRQPLRVPNGLLIFRDLSWRGFWVSRWYRAATAGAVAAMFGELFTLAGRGLLESPIEATYPLHQVTAALTHAARSGRSGKILFKPNQ